MRIGGSFVTKKLLLITGLLCCLLCVGASAVSLEQVQSVMPEISVYIHDNGEDLTALSAGDIQATLDGKSLAVEELAPSEEGIFYVFMLDISKSISRAHLEAAKQAVLSTYQQLRQQDQLALIAFGNEVQLLLGGSESAQQVQSTLDALEPTDNNTRFYDAMDTLVKTATAKTNMRRVAVVVSDGVDDPSQSGMTQEQLEDILRQSGVAVYAMAVDSAPKAALDNFRQFIEVSGGSLYTFSPANASAMLTQLLTRIDAIWRLNLRADSNIADGETHALEVSFGSLGSVSTDIRPVNWTPDREPPYLLSLSTDSAGGTVTVAFSEAMAGIDDPAHFQIHGPDGKEPEVRIAAAEADKVTLAAEGISDAAGWELAISGLTDASMEKNAMPSCTVPLSGVTQQPSSSAAQSAGNAAPDAVQTAKSELIRTVAILAGVVLAAVAAIIVALRVRRRSPKAKVKEEKRPAEKQTVRFLFRSDSHEGEQEKK